MAGGCGVRHPPSASVASRVLMPGRVVRGTVRAGSSTMTRRARSPFESQCLCFVRFPPWMENSVAFFVVQ